MSVPPEVAHGYVVAELEQAQEVIQCLDLTLDTSMFGEANLRFRVSGKSRVDGEPYVVEFQCDGYRAIPPFVEFVDPRSGALGPKQAYPSCFHNHPCICARYNRKTYPDHSALHRKWSYGDWSSERETDHLGGMISHIWSHIHGYQGSYNGRQA